MKERPILFSAPMVRAILEGRKTQTRRVAPITDLNIKPHSDDQVTWGVSFSKPVKGVLGSYSGGKLSVDQAKSIIASMFNPYGQPGDRLWVRETHCAYGISKDGFDHFSSVHYMADGDRLQHKIDAHTYRKLFDTEQRGEWTPSIHMPRWASRILLEITAVRVERLNDISEDDAIAEGTPGGHGAIPGYGYAATPGEHYHWLWESINGAGSWDANPWVWVIEFKKVGAEQ